MKIKVENIVANVVFNVVRIKWFFFVSSRVLNEEEKKYISKLFKEGKKNNEK